MNTLNRLRLWQEGTSRSSTVQAPPVVSTARPPERTGRRGLRRLPTFSSSRAGAERAAAAAAVVSWLIGLPAALLLVRFADLNPLTVRGAVMPIAVGSAVAAVLLAVSFRRYSAVLIGVAAGSYAAWVGLTLASALWGTPLGYGSMSGDFGRLTAMATRFTVTSASADPVAAGVPSEYPPLFPWLIGHAASLLHRPAYTLMGDGQVLTMSLAVLVSFLLWLRLVPAPAALAIAVVGPVMWGEPSKNYEVFVLVVLLPWLLGAFVRLPSGRFGLGRVAAGVIGGLMVATYMAYVLFAALGLLAVALLAWRASEERRSYAIRCTVITGIALVVSSWYVIPLAVWHLTRGSQMVADQWLGPTLADAPLQLLIPWHPLITPLQLIGLVGALVLRRRVWWAQPVLLIVASAYLYLVFYLVWFIRSGHNGLAYYTAPLVFILLVSAGILTIAHVLPSVRRLLPTPLPAGVGAVVLTFFIASCAFTSWSGWTPTPHGSKDVNRPSGAGPNSASSAHAEPLPDGSMPRYAATRPSVRWFPVDPVRQAVEQRIGGNSLPVTLSYDYRLFAYLPWHGYISNDRTSTNALQRWDDRYAELKGLASIADPAEFAARSAGTRFGGIDVFVLSEVGGQYRWRDLAFATTAFGAADFDVLSLPQQTIVAIRRSTEAAAANRAAGPTVLSRVDEQ